MRANDIEIADDLDNPNRVELLHSQTDDEGDAAEENERKRLEAEEKKKAAENPQEYNCAACTMLNPIGNANCDLCGTPRPSMEEIIAASNAAGAGGPAEEA
jgi:hypothetical protein